MLKSIWQKILSVLVALSAAVMVAGCANGINEDSGSKVALLMQLSASSSKSTAKYASVTVDTGSESSRNVDVSTIKFAKIYVSGDGIVAGEEPSSDFTAISGGKTQSGAKIVVNNVPVGNNKVVTVYAYDESQTKIEPVVLRAVVDVSADSTNNVSVNKASTPLGNVLFALSKSNTALSNVSISKISAAIKSGVHYSLIDTDKIAEDYKKNSLGSADSYVIAASTVNVTANNCNGCTVQISDPLSAPQTITSDSAVLNFENVTPGTWGVYVLKDGKTKYTKVVTVTAGASADVTIGQTTFDGIQIQVPVEKGYPLIHYFDCENSGKYPDTTWPGVEMKSGYRADDSETEYYYYNFDGISKISLLVTNSNQGKYHEGDMKISAKGVYLIHGSQDPELLSADKLISDAPVPPVVKVSLSGSTVIVNSSQDIISGTVTISSGSKTETIVAADFSDKIATKNLSFWGMSDGAAVVAEGVLVAEGGAATISERFTFSSKISDSIVVHAKYPVIYIWQTGDSSLDQKEFNMTAEGGQWYKYTLPVTSANIIFKQAGSWDGKTGDLKLSGAGEYWYYNNKWYESNPEDKVYPVLVSFTSDKTGTVSGKITFTVKATDNLALKEAEIYLGSEKVSSIALSGTDCEGSYVFDTSTVKNGSYTLTCKAVDEAGNKSEASAPITITTKNANLPPVAVINGASRIFPGASKTLNCAGSYDQNGGTIASYKWTVSGGATWDALNKETITITAPESAVKDTVYTITLVLTDDEGAQSVAAEKTLTVADKASDTGDFRDESIYFVMTTRFYDGDSSNNEYCWDEGGEYLAFGAGDCAWRGDFKGLAQKLDYIKALGFSAIWITPVVENASGIDYHGYHAYDFSKVDPRYESTGYKYQDFIDECHAKGIKVIQDIVLNHSGNFGERNLFHMFDKDTVPYENKDIPVPAGGKRSPFMKLAKEGNAYSKLMAGLSIAGGSDYDNEKGGIQYGARINAMKEDSIDTDFIYHHAKMIDWNSENCQLGQMAGDCVDLNTENPVVFNYLKDCYTKYIEMGVDAFRIDTVKHISRYTFNKEFIPAFMEAGGENFYIFGETCARYRGRWNEGVPALSPSFYTWKENKDFAWSQSDHTVNSASASAHFATYKSDFAHPAWADGIANHLLDGNDYHTPDWTMRSHLDQIDFPMHWAFSNANDAFRTAVGTNDPDFNDATWNVVYVDSHDYAPDNAPEGQRYSKTDEWPRNMNLMFSFRGIPCLYYGSEVMFMAGAPIDPANTRTSLDKSGRAYFGEYIEGTVTASDYSEYTASGTVAETLSHPLAKHVTRLNKIRRSIAALRKGQYSTEGCSGSIAFKRRYTDENVDSFALVAIGGKATFSGVPSGTYIEVITGKEVSCSGSLTSDEIDQNNMRIYVLKTSTCEVDGKIGEDGEYLK